MARWVKTESNGYANLDLATDIMISEDCHSKFHDKGDFDSTKKQE